MMAGWHDEWLLICESAERTKALGAALGRLLTPGAVICLSGELGAGKTVFSRGIGAGWGATVPLTSPTYNLAHEHERKQDKTLLFHIDFYRIRGPRDAETLGIHEILEGGDIVLFEWPERIPEFLPAEHMWIDFMICEDEERALTFAARGERHGALLAELRRSLSREQAHAAGD